MIMDYRALTRIASAQYDAQRMRLPGTADRLDILRREMERFHDFRGEKLDTKKKWALAKLEDIERTLGREKEQITDEDREHFESMRSVSRCVKTVMYLGITAIVMDMLKRVAGGGMADIALVLAAGAAVTLTMSKLVERFFGGTFESASKNIQKAVLECKEALKQGQSF
jgi:hypothetical protein